MVHSDCSECVARNGRGIARGILGAVLAVALASSAGLIYLFQCLDSSGWPLILGTLPATILAAVALAFIVVPRKRPACGHERKGALDGAMGVLFGPPASPGAFPGRPVAHSVATLALAVAAAVLAFPPTNETVAWRAVVASSDPEPVYAYAEEWPGRRPQSELAALAWERIRTSDDPARFRRLLDAFPPERDAPASHAALVQTRAGAWTRIDEIQKARNEALAAKGDAVTLAEKEQLMARIAAEERTVLASGSGEACVEFLARCPWSGRAGEIRDLLLRQLEKNWTKESGRCPPAALRVLFAAGASGPIGFSLSGPAAEACRAGALKAAEETLAQFGFKAASSVPDKAVLHITVEFHEKMKDVGDTMGPLFSGGAKDYWAAGRITIRAPGSTVDTWTSEFFEKGHSPDFAGVGLRRAFSTGDDR